MKNTRILLQIELPLIREEKKENIHVSYVERRLQQMQEQLRSAFAISQLSNFVVAPFVLQLKFKSASNNQLRVIMSDEIANKHMHTTYTHTSIQAYGHTDKEKCLHMCDSIDNNGMHLCISRMSSAVV